MRSELWHRAQQLIPGGVNSPVRAMRSVGLDEPFPLPANIREIRVDGGQAIILQ